MFIVDQIKVAGFDPNGCRSATIRDLMMIDQPKDYWDKLIVGLLDHPVETRHAFMARTYYCYLIHDAMCISQGMMPTCDHEIFLHHVATKVEKHCAKSFSSPDVTPSETVVSVTTNQMPANVNPQKNENKRSCPSGSRGTGTSKRERCIALHAQLTTEGKKPPEIIQAFMKELDLSKPGATTYEYNVRKGVWK